MIEPLIQDYINAFTELDRDTFCANIGVPVLVSRVAKDGIAFQDAATRMLPLEKPESDEPAEARLNHMQPVVELRKASEESNSQLTIGRAEENDVVVHDETVSSRHAVMFTDVRSGQNMLQDLDSTNGTAVNGALLRPGRAVALKEGDTVSFGDSEYLFFTPGGLYDEIEQIVPKPA
jgi:pSer/pThr/pTyr-binding forkhead associated (FHA) protein